MSKTPPGWKNYDDFAAGIATNRLPATAAFAGKTMSVAFAEGSLEMRFIDAHRVAWRDGRGAGEDWYELIEIGDGSFFLDMSFNERPLEALTLVFSTATRRALGIRCRIRSEAEAAGMPRVAQDFLPGTLEAFSDGLPATVTGMAPAPTRDLIGLRTLQTYSPHHTYEHTYLSAERYCWQCLVGVQRGHGDVDLASYYRIDEKRYVFCFREFLIPVASVFLFDFAHLRSTGKFLGVTGAGTVENKPAGAFIRKLSQAFYPEGVEPV